MESHHIFLSIAHTYRSWFRTNFVNRSMDDSPHYYASKQYRTNAGRNCACWLGSLFVGDLMRAAIPSPTVVRPGTFRLQSCLLWRLRFRAITIDAPSRIVQHTHNENSNTLPCSSFILSLSMKVLVGVKRVVDYAVKVRVTKGTVDLANVKQSMNPFCEVRCQSQLSFPLPVVLLTPRSCV